MNQINLFIEITRLKKPIGFMLLFWPCAWGLTLAYEFNNNLFQYFFYLTLFFLGAVLMRSAGCIVNDIFDKEFDKKVFRTKNRPLATEKISIQIALFYVFLLCSLALIVVINFNQFTIFLAFLSMPLAFAYPLMKRFTYWPQLFLGITFNYGLILGWTSIMNEINFVPLLFYLGAIFWTLGYDTIYGFQDIEDDEIIGLKSTSLKFREKPKLFVFVCYFILILSLITGGYLMNFNKIYFIIIILPLLHLFIQIKNLNPNDPNNCLNTFKSNNYLGVFILLSIFIGKTF